MGLAILVFVQSIGETVFSFFLFFFFFFFFHGVVRVPQSGALTQNNLQCHCTTSADKLTNDGGFLKTISLHPNVNKKILRKHSRLIRKVFSHLYTVVQYLRSSPVCISGCGGIYG